MPSDIGSNLHSDFNPRSPCGERPHLYAVRFRLTNFNPRSPCGERPLFLAYSPASVRISIHALLAESDPSEYVMALQFVISIHALLAESDRLFCRFVLWDKRFQSTLSLRRATRLRCSPGWRRGYFNPRSPCGERPALSWALSLLYRFQSTLSLRRATGSIGSSFTGGGNFNPRSPCGERPTTRTAACTRSSISIHALLAESDRWSAGSTTGS